MDYTAPFDGASASQRSRSCIGYIISAFVAALMLVALISGGMSDSQPQMLNAIGFPGARLGEPRSFLQPKLNSAITPLMIGNELKAYGIASTPLTELAVTAIDTNNRINRARGVSTQAVSNEMISGWSLVEPKTRDRLAEVVKEVKYKSSLLAGVTAPMNYFDPLGFSTTVDAGKLLFYREVELKHGRIAMLAALGILVGEQFHPLFGGDIDVPAAFAFQQTPLQNFWPAVVAAIAIPEIYSVFTFKEPGLKGADQWTIREDHEPGNLGFDPLGLKPTDPNELKEMQTKELNNGRLAMIAAAGMIAQELATGQKIF
eukprot:gnl/TRDRNA2_/TRDRNA2_175317_c0_seq2.p1 gnl/TRDRNA2_/TRDRNA2_175317_c0~~gnl/TRDRNA2_/TRDRNA2_175317_c0_seq2.p1  ORF type:complete len:337 (-),score=60.42 gnl/TRDRNA2_/TRDRNA2_175317_c0_seq2:300-1247(-)